MKKFGILLFASIFIFVIIAFQKPPKSFSLIFPKHWPNPTIDFKTYPITEEGIELGRDLFYDPILSKDNTISCASCHSPFMSFAHVDHSLSHGIADSIGNRNAPALINLAWHKSFMWDGAINHIEMQALAPITDPREMGETLENVIEKLENSEYYKAYFVKLYGKDKINSSMILKVLSQFQISLISANSKYDQVSLGLDSFTERENRGYLLFKKNCNQCHQEPLFTDHSFANNGLEIDPYLQDYGRYNITGNVQDSFVFKVPTLRNISFTPPYMHDGRFLSLQTVLNHYINLNQKKAGILDERLHKKIALSHQQKIDLIDFLKTLSDPSFLKNKKFHNPKSI